MKPHFALKLPKKGLFCIFICFTATVFAQKPIQLIKTALVNLYEMPYFKNLKRNPGLHYFGSPSEGCRVAAKDGRFGYVNHQNDWIIPPQYDYAYSFSEGLGIAFLDGQALYLDKDGHKPFNTDFVKDLSPFVNGRALFRTHSGKMGLFNKQGQILIDTIFTKIYPFDFEELQFNPYQHPKKYRGATLAINTHTDQSKKTMTITEYGLIDTNGHILVPFGQFQHISTFIKGYATATQGDSITLFDSNGERVIRLYNDSTKAITIPTPVVVDYGLFRVVFNSTNSKRYGLMNLKGELILNDTTINSIFDYDNEKAFCYDKEHDHKLVYFDKQVKKGDYPLFSRVPKLYNLRKYGVDVASVQLLESNKWGIIDSCFNWIIPPQYDGIQLNEKFLKNTPYFELTNDLLSDEAKEGGRRAKMRCIADIKGNILTEHKVLDFITPKDSTLMKFHFVTANGKKQGTMDRCGQILDSRETIKGNNTNEQLRRLLAKVYNREPWQVRIDDANNNSVSTDNYGDSNTPNIYKKAEYTPETTAQAQVVFSESDTFYIKKNFERKVIKARLINTTSDTLAFKTAQNQLNVIIQAQDEKGNWRKISTVRVMSPYEKVHKQPDKRLCLPPQYFWEIELPIYDGAIKTKCRCLIYTDVEGTVPIISKEWTSSINPAQFWRSPIYEPSRLFEIWWDMYETD